MSFNSPFNNPNQDADSGSAPADNFNHANVPAYGHVPEVPATGKNSTISVVGLVLSIIFPLIGLIVSIVAWRQAAETGDNKGLAKAGIIVGAIFFALSIISTFVLFGSLATMDASSLDTTGL